MKLTAYLTKTAITWGEIQIGNVLDDYMITEVEHNDEAGAETRVYFLRGGGWSDWRPSTTPVSVYR